MSAPTSSPMSSTACSVCTRSTLRSGIFFFSSCESLAEEFGRLSMSNSSRHWRSSLCGWHFKAASGCAQVRKLWQVARLEIGGEAISDQRGCRVRFKGLVDQWNSRAGYRAQLDRDSIIEDATPIRESGQVATQDAQQVRIACRGNRHI